MGLALNFGQMALAMKVSGGMTRLTDKANLCMLTATFMKANGSMIRLKVMALIHTPMVHTTKVSGLMINSTETELSLGPMAPDMKDAMKMARRKDKEDSLLLTEVTTKAHLNKMKSVVSDITIGRMVNPMQATGVRTRWTVKVSCAGRMERCTQETL